MKNIILFDMDGTLTLPRQKIEKNIIPVLKNLSKKAKIAIVSGSGFDYIKYQCSSLWDGLNGISPLDIEILPCNGTQRYVWKKTKWVKKTSLDMKEHVSDKSYNILVRHIFEIQRDIINCEKYLLNFSLSGNFISYRGSLLNWCPIGRDSDEKARESFKKLDSKEGMRNVLFYILQNNLKEKNSDILDKIDIALGGSTSLDIYPIGWDKTLALSYYKDLTCWFVGDKCEERGNDYSIFTAIKNDNKNHAYKTSSPDETIEIINKKIIPALS